MLTGAREIIFSLPRLKIEHWKCLLESEKKRESLKTFKELCRRGCTVERPDAKYPGPGVMMPSFLTLHSTLWESTF